MKRKGSLSDCDKLAQELNRTASRILEIQKRGTRESTALDKLFVRAGETSIKVLQSMVNDAGVVTRPIEYAGKTCAADIADYCLRYFVGMGSREKSSHHILMALPLVQQFASAVKRMKGKSIDTRRGEAEDERGTIAGEALFCRNSSFRYLGVPVREYQGQGSSDHWRKLFSLPKGHDIIIPHADIFLPRVLAEKKFIERQSSKTGYRGYVDYSSERYIGGHAPKAYTLTIGTPSRITTASINFSAILKADR